MKAISSISVVAYCILSVWLIGYTDTHFPGMVFFAEQLLLVNWVLIIYIKSRDPVLRKATWFGKFCTFSYLALLLGMMGLFYYREVTMNLVFLSVFPMIVALGVSMATINTFALAPATSSPTCTSVLDTLNSTVLLAVGSALVTVAYGGKNAEDYAMLVIGSYTVILGLMLTASLWLAYRYEEVKK